MRMWMVPPQELCNNHLLGEHHEIHKLIGTIENHPHGEAIIKGLANDGMIELASIPQRHAELVEEMEARGMNHQSPLPDVDFPNLGEVSLAKSRKDLVERCNDCRRRIEEM